VLPALLLAARFFVMGDGSLALVNAHNDERAAVHYRRKDGTYDPAELGRIRHLVRSQGDARETDVSLRLVEVLSWLQHTAGGKPLVVLSGYRSPDYNQGLKTQGKAVAGGSLHTEGLATDLAFPRAELPRLWHRVRDLDCCGAGYYAKEGFLHVDVGRPRFWEATTSRVDENLSAGNARMFARTEFDRYAAGERMAVTLHAITVPPVLIRREAKVGGETLRVDAELPEKDGCYEVGSSGAHLRLAGARPVRRAPVVLSTCEPRSERTPETVETNPVEVYGTDTALEGRERTVPRAARTR